MALKDDLTTDVAQIFRETWTKRKGNVVPSDASLTLSNDGVELDATVLYADLSDSTQLVDNHPHALAAEVYKAFLRCAARIINAESGTITAYDGDRVMAVFLGDTKNTVAVRAGLKINCACKNIIQPAITKQYPQVSYVLKHVVGIDTSDLLAARAGVRGANDLVWIGKAANHAAKLCALDHDYPTWITKAVYDRIQDASKLSNGRNMWESCTWTAMGGASIYRSSYSWSL
jgi:class 3 adenylate cyclase